MNNSILYCLTLGLSMTKCDEHDITSQEDRHHHPWSRDQTSAVDIAAAYLHDCACSDTISLITVTKTDLYCILAGVAIRFLSH